MQFLNLSGVLTIWNNIKTYIDRIFSVFTSGKDGLILVSRNNEPVWEDMVKTTFPLATDTADGLMSAADKAKIDATSVVYELIIKDSDYNKFINQTASGDPTFKYNGCVNPGSYQLNTVTNAADFSKNIVNCKYLKISNGSGRTTYMSTALVWKTSTTPLWCGFQLNKGDGILVFSYATIRFTTTTSNIVNCNVDNMNLPLLLDLENISTTLSNKVDKVSGKQLSTNDFTNAYKSKLDNLGSIASVTKTSLLINDSGFITSSSLPTKTSLLSNDSGFITTTSFKNTYVGNVSNEYNTFEKLENIIKTIQSTVNEIYKRDSIEILTYDAYTKLDSIDPKKLYVIKE